MVDDYMENLAEYKKERFRQRHIEQIAKTCHEANKAYCEAIGDFSQLPWSDAPEWQRRSCLDGVRFHLEAARSPGDSHRNWLAEKERNGWKYGPVKNEVLKTHPCCVPFEQLSASDKTKDFIFTAIVRSFSVEG